MPNNRDQIIDCIKGMWFCLMLIIHSGYYSFLTGIASESLGVVTSAEFLVFCSGMSIGILYRTKRDQHNNIKSVAKKVTLRGFFIYVICVLNVLFIYLMTISHLPINLEYITTFHGYDGRYFKLFPHYDPTFTGIYHAIIDAILLKYAPHQIQILGLYSILLIISPFFIYMLNINLILFLISFVTIYNVNSILRISVTTAQFEYAFSLLSWQLLFNIALVFGFYKEETFKLITKSLRDPIQLFLLCGIIIACFILSHANLAEHNTVLYDQLFSKQYLGSVRLVNTLVLFVAMYLILDKYKAKLSYMLNFFGSISQSILFLFCIHIYIILIFHNIIEPAPQLSEMLQIFMQIGVLFTVYYTYKMKSKLEQIFLNRLN